MTNDSKPSREAKRAYDRDWYHANKHRILERKNRLARAWRAKRRMWLWGKKSVPCLDCQGKFPPYVMQFDHVGDKSFEIGTAAINKSLKELEAEISKCEIVCANCHAVRTFGRLYPDGYNPESADESL